jgi:hypothetical protein
MYTDWCGDCNISVQGNNYTVEADEVKIGVALPLTKDSMKR